MKLSKDRTRERSFSLVFFMSADFEEKDVSKLKTEMELRRSSRDRNYLFTGLVFMQLLLLAVWSPLALAQHEMHDMTASVELNSMPANDEVLAAAPESLMLHFGSEMRLVKLALKASEHGFVNIDFRYNPKPGVHFTQVLPALAAANYYTVEWAAFNSDEELLKGSFHFSFGDNARPPSYYRDQMEGMVHDAMPLDYRTL